MSTPPRTTVDAVNAVLGYNWDGQTDVTPYIQTASAMVDLAQTNDQANSNILNSVILELIERWLAAHYYCVNDQTYQSKNTGRASGSFEGQTQQGMRSTRFGGQALDLDPTRYLSALNNRGKVGFVHLGTNPCFSGTGGSPNQYFGGQFW